LEWHWETAKNMCQDNCLHNEMVLRLCPVRHMGVNHSTTTFDKCASITSVTVLPVRPEGLMLKGQKHY
jgi:hypothetical protein